MLGRYMAPKTDMKEPCSVSGWMDGRLAYMAERCKSCPTSLIAWIPTSKLGTTAGLTLCSNQENKPTHLPTPPMPSQDAAFPDANRPCQGLQEPLEPLSKSVCLRVVNQDRGL